MDTQESYDKKETAGSPQESINQENVWACAESSSEEKYRTIGRIAVGCPRKNKTFSVLYRDRIFYAVDRAIVSVMMDREKETAGIDSAEDGTKETKESIEYITTVESTISAMHVSSGLISLGTVTGEIVLMDLENRIIFRDNLQTGVYSISHTKEAILVSVQYALLKIDILEKNCYGLSSPAEDTGVRYREYGPDRKKYQAIAEMNDIVLFIDVIETEAEKVIVYSNSNTLFINEQSVRYTGNIMFMRAILLPDQTVRIAVGLSTRKVHMYTYKNRVLKLQHIISTKGLITDGILLPSSTIVVLNNSINIYDHANQMECIGMIGPYEQDILKAFLIGLEYTPQEDRIDCCGDAQKDGMLRKDKNSCVEDTLYGEKGRSKPVLEQIYESLYIVLDGGSIFKYAPEKKLLPTPGEEPETEGKDQVLWEIYKNLARIDFLWNGPVNIASGSTERIRALKVWKNCIVTASGPSVRIFKIHNSQPYEVFRPVVDGFPINGFIPRWNGMFVATSNNILKVYSFTHIYKIAVGSVAHKGNILCEKYKACVSRRKDETIKKEEALEEEVSLRNEVSRYIEEEIEFDGQTPFTAVKQELSLTTVPVVNPSKEEIEYAASTIQCDLGIGNNHLVEKEKIYGFPFEISTVTSIDSSMLLISCSSSQKEFSNLFVLNRQLEIVQKVFVHSKTITHVSVSDGIVATAGKDRRIAVYAVCQLKDLQSRGETESTENTENSEDLGLKLLDVRIDHKKEILTLAIHNKTVITASRDKTLITYRIEQGKLQIEKVQNMDRPVTAIRIDKERISTRKEESLILGDSAGYLHINNRAHKIHNSPISHIETYKTEENSFYVTATEEGVLKISNVKEFLKTSAK